MLSRNPITPAGYVASTLLSKSILWIKDFNVVLKLITLNYLPGKLVNRSTNASAESFNVKKGFDVFWELKIFYYGYLSHFG
jgi:hypothetical protein